MSDASSGPSIAVLRQQRLFNLSHVVYGLYGLSVLFGSVTFGVSLILQILGLVIAHIRIGETTSQLVRDHFRWQIRTFWWSLLWNVSATALLFYTYFGGSAFLWSRSSIGIYLPELEWLMYLPIFLWWVYRITKGWLYLVEHRTPYGGFLCHLSPT